MDEIRPYRTEKEQRDDDVRRAEIDLILRDCDHDEKDDVPFHIPRD